MVTKSGSAIWIYMNGEKVGRLSRSSTGKLELAYADTWLTSQRRRPLSLSLPLGKTPIIGDSVHNFFDNLLPDSTSIRRRIQARVKASSTDSFDILWHIGRDCVGAMQLLPEEFDQVDVRKIEGRAVSDAEMADILTNYKTMPLGMGEEEDFRISLAGAQEKTAFLRSEGEWYQPLHMTPTTHIFKLPMGKNSQMDLSDSVENEWLCHLLLKEFSVPVANSYIWRYEKTKALVVDRFDRKLSSDGTWIIRIPQEDICQALGIAPALKYEKDKGPGIVEVMNLLRGSQNRSEDTRVFMKCQFIFWLLAAIDGHGKNFSIFLEQEGRYVLTPIYDVISVHPVMREGGLPPQRAKMAMAQRGKKPHYAWERIKYRHWLNTAKLCGYPQDIMEGIISEVLDTMDLAIERTSSQVAGGEVERVGEAIFAGMRQSREMLVKSREEEL
jgi:serine/threonine-protein kinase HipA